MPSTYTSLGSLDASLGINARIDSALSAPGLTPDTSHALATLDRFALLSEARSLAGSSHRVRLCRRALRPDRVNVEVWHAPLACSASFHGLQVCGSVWDCPIDAPKVTEDRRRDLAASVAFARGNGLRVLFESLTFSHHAWDRLAVSLRTFLAALRRFSTGRRAEGIAHDFARVGLIRALEVTWGSGSGWHPHGHLLSFVPSELDVDAYAARRRAHWRAVTASLGLFADDEHGYQLEDTNDRVADYLAKFGHEPRWDVDRELSKWHVKRARSTRCTPFDLLRYSFAGDQEAGQRWREYSDCFFGQRQLWWSHGLRQLLQVGEERSDEEIAGDYDEGAALLGLLSRAQWRAVVANDVRGELLNAAAAGSWESVCQLLRAIGADEEA